ncbi:AMP-binding protein [Guyparkeria sp. 1SP6A2]|nr:AMP-binding protein [Guyparkeria sp. 1SP6A2]
MPLDLITAIARHAEERPSAHALGDRREWLDYATLAGRIAAARATLDRLGLEAGDRVVLWAGKDTHTVVWLLAMLAGDIVPTPAHPGLRAEQVAHQLRQCGAKGLLVDRPRLTQWLAQWHPDRNTEGAWHWLAAASPGAPLTVDPPVQTSPLADRQDARPERLAMLFFTSGSTGLPKGVMVSEGNLDTGARIVADYLGLGADDVLAAILPLAFDYGFSQVTTGLLRGAAVYLDDYLLPADLKRPLLRQQATILAGTPGLLIPLARQPWLAEAPALRAVTNSGGSLPLTTIRRLRAARPETKLFLMYGLTEGFRATYLPPEEVDRHPDSIGYALPQTPIGLVDAAGGLLGPGQTGELVQGGPLVALGYINDAEATRARFRPPPADWPHPDEQRVVFSGDRVHMDAQGRLFFAGRLDEQIKVAGFRISPEEIEAVALGAPGVEEAVALGLPDTASGNQRLVLHVAPAEVDMAVLRHHLRIHLAGHQQPATIQAHAALPRSNNGKLDRLALKEA